MFDRPRKVVNRGNFIYIMKLAPLIMVDLAQQHRAEGLPYASDEEDDKDDKRKAEKR